jgi:hypothetical protein
MMSGPRRERGRHTETHVLLVCVPFPLLYGKNLDRGTKPSPLPNLCLPFLPQSADLHGGASPTRALACLPHPRPRSILVRPLLSLSSSLVPGGATVKGGQNRGGASLEVAQSGAAHR